MKKLLLWLLMVVVMVALLLGGAAAALYAMTGENKLPQNPPTLGEAALEPNGYDWTVPVLGHVVERNFSSLTNLTVQKLGDMGDTSPVLTLPDWVNRSEMTLTGPDGAVLGELPLLGCTDTPPALREEYDQYALVQFWPLSLWQSLDWAPAAEPGLTVRLLGPEGITAAGCEALQAAALEWRCQWAWPPYGGMDYDDSPGDFAKRLRMNVAWFPVDRSLPYARLTGFTEPVLQRRVLAVTDD